MRMGVDKARQDKFPRRVDALVSGSLHLTFRADPHDTAILDQDRMVMKNRWRRARAQHRSVLNK
jgi:hypothetical protein